MPSYFQFTQGTESRVRPNDSSPLLGRYRAVPPRDHHYYYNYRQPATGKRQVGMHSNRRGSVHVGYGALVLDQLDDGDDSDDNDDDLDDDDDGVASRWRRTWRRWVVDLWVRPKQLAVKRIVERWWTRYGLLVLLPAVLTVAWCSLPFPQFPLPHGGAQEPNTDAPEKTPGHGRARVQVSFWFFLLVYYGLYNITALVWISKVFNLYSLNWWPRSLGFPLMFTLIAALSLAVPIPVYYIQATRFLASHNTAWISWTFITMAMPVATALLVLRSNERHIGLRNSLSETQRIFAGPSWWVNGDNSGRTDTWPRRDRAGRRVDYPADDPFGTGEATDEDEAELLHATAAANDRMPNRHRRVLRRPWFPASFVRFIWFSVALFIGLMAYVLGEAYAELYLRTLPHNSLETVVYVYGWVITVHLLDALTGWVLGIREGERVGSYPLNWVFKLYFMLTYQTYVRALYARLRSPSQFVILQVLSSTTLVILTPLTMTNLFHRILTILGFTTLSYGTYQKLQVRNVFIRLLAENASMAAFLGSVLVLHFGANKHVYPYFALDVPSEPYDFDRTFYASSVTWACELIASMLVRALIRVCFAVDVGREGRADLAVWPELLPTCVAVTLHVLQNMLFSIIRLQFIA